MCRNKGIPGLGIILVVFGIILLLDSFDVIVFHWSYILIALGAAFFVISFISTDKGAVFPGTILFLTGLFFLLRYNYILGDSMFYLWPIFPAIVGIAFLALFIFRPSDWGLLIPGGILLFVGIIFLAYNYDFFDYNPGRIVSRYWPVILIAIGAKMILSKK